MNIIIILRKRAMQIDLLISKSFKEMWSILTNIIKPLFYKYGINR